MKQSKKLQLYKKSLIAEYSGYKNENFSTCVAIHVNAYVQE